MLKKLKIRLILHNMLILAFVFTLLFAAFSVIIYFREENKITSTLNQKMNEARDIFSEVIEEKSAEDKTYQIALTVYTDANGTVIKSTGAGLENVSLQNAIDYALSTDVERGNYKELEISYLKKTTSTGYMISFLSREHLSERIKENISQGALAGFIFLLVFGAISIRLATMAVKPVEKAWEQQKQFLADASHDLKTPLTVILANNNIIASHKDQTVESQIKWIESTKEEAERMSELVNKMLELAKSEATKDELKIGEVDLSELVDNAILQFEVVAFEKNISIESGVQPNMIVRTHPASFSKVLEILFDNAIKYSEENGKINIALYQYGKKIYFTINNKGEPIKPEELPHIFERFYRTNKERKVGGHGLGLSIAKKKCDMLGCKLSVESNEEDGTTFTITLKARRK